MLFCRSYFSASETIIGIRGKQFSMKELNITSGELIFWLVQNHFAYIFQIFQWNPSFRLVKMDFRAKNSLIKEYCFHSTARTKVLSNRYISSARKSCLDRQEYLKKCWKWFPMVGKRLLFRKWIHLNSNNQHKVCSK